jgi:pSer/pThr/pTyr-binding forkhead associated (FHA) protein
MTAAAKAPSGRKIWKALRDELTLNLYPLPFSTLAPTVYHVYLHPDDYESIEGVVPKVVSQLQQALTAEVDNINGGLRRSTRRILARFLDREELPPIEIPAGGWEVHVRADRNGELEHGQLGIVSTLALPSPPEYAGTPTTRIVRSVVGGGRRSSATTEAQPAATPALVPAQVVPPGDVAAAPPTASVRATDVRDSRDRARLVYQDDQGPHVFMMRKDTLSVGRGGSSAWVDVQVIASSKISREHLRLRLDPNGQFYIQDVSVWGTSVDGVTIPPAVKSAEGVAQPGPEQPLPARARIALADALEIQFEAIGTP